MNRGFQSAVLLAVKGIEHTQSSQAQISAHRAARGFVLRLGFCLRMHTVKARADIELHSWYFREKPLVWSDMTGIICYFMMLKNQTWLKVPDVIASFYSPFSTAVELWIWQGILNQRKSRTNCHVPKSLDATTSPFRAYKKFYFCVLFLLLLSAGSHKAQGSCHFKTKWSTMLAFGTAS